MPTPKRGVAAKGRLYVKDEDTSPASSPRRRANDAVSPRGARGGIHSPTKVPQGVTTPSRKLRTSEDVRAEAFPIVPRGRGRPPSNKSTPVASKFISDSDVSPSRRSRRTTEQTGEEDMPTSSRSRMNSVSTNASKMSPRASPMATPRRERIKSQMEAVEELSEGYDESEGRGKRKRKLTEAAEASHAQARSRKNSRRISERTDQQLEEEELELEPIHEELTEPIEGEVEETEEHEVIDDVAHEEMVHAVSPEDMYMQSHVRPLHSVMGAQRTRGMHVMTEEDELLDEQLVEEEDEHALEEMVVYEDGDGNILYDGEEELGHEEIIEDDEHREEMEMMRHHDHTGRHGLQSHRMDEMSHHHQQQRGDMMHRRQDMGRRMVQPHEMKQEGGEEDDGEEGEEEDDDDDEQPPLLEPEEGPAPEEIMMHESMERGGQMMDPYEDQTYMQSPGGTHYMPDDEMYVDGGVDHQGGGMMQIVDGGETGRGGGGGGGGGQDLRTVEFNFLDHKNVCCGLCGDIVPYESLLSEHLPMQHPEVYGEQGAMDLEEISYDSWLKDKLYHEKKSLENGFRTMGGYEQQQQGTSGMSRIGRNRSLRRVSQVRVNPGLMSLAQLDTALKKKMIEKMGRKVKVSLVDKQHARCGICNAVVSLNKKFEVVHLVRHFNAWHPSVHRCSGAWPNRAHLTGPGKPLSGQDFAVVDQALDAPESLQCIWCGMFMDRTMLAMHFHEVHADDVEVPKCHLCLQEVVINARLLEKFGQDFGITLPDEHHIKCGRLNDKTFSTEAALDRFIERRKERMEAMESGEVVPSQEDEEEEDEAAAQEDAADAAQQRDPQYSNSRMAFGRRNKPKRNFIMPSLRQAIPQDSRFVEALNEGEWRCKMCGEPILAAVISAGAIKHYRTAHPDQLEEMQYELCKARLERVSDGCMEFVNSEMIECLICNLTYTLHKPYNMCRGIRHLKTKHPHMMPEYNRNQGPKNANKYKAFDQSQLGPARVEMGEYVNDPAVISKLKEEYDYEFDKVQEMFTAGGERVLVLVTDGQEINQQVAENIQASIMEVAQTGDTEDEDEEEEEEEEGVIVEEEEYQMEDEIVVRHEDHDAAHLATVAAGVRRRPQPQPQAAVQRVASQMVVMDDVEEEEEEQVEQEGGEEAEEQQHEEMVEEEREEMVEEELVEEETVNEGQQFQ